MPTLLIHSGVTGNTGAPSFRPQHVVEKNVVRKHNNLPPLRCLFGQPFGNSLHACMVQGRNGIIDNDPVIVTEFSQLGQKTGERQGTLLPFAQNVAVISNAFAARSGNLDDAFSGIAAIRQIERNMREPKRFQLVI